jgi:hypothetical protein
MLCVFVLLLLLGGPCVEGMIAYTIIILYYAVFRGATTVFLVRSLWTAFFRVR